MQQKNCFIEGVLALTCDLLVRAICR